MQGNDREDVIEIDLREILGLVLHWAWLIALCGVVTGIIGFIMSSVVIAPKYESTTKIYILNKQSDNAITYSDTQLATQLTKDYNELITSRYVLENVIAECSLEDSYEDLQNRIAIENKTDTRIIGITVKDEDPVSAQFIANTLRDVASGHITVVMDIEAVNIVELANLPTEPSEPSVMRWTAIGILLGIFACAAVIIIRYLVDDTVRSAEDIENYLGLSTLALIPDTRLEEKEGRKNRNKRPKGSVDQPRVGSSDRNGKSEEIEIIEVTDN